MVLLIYVLSRNASMYEMQEVSSSLVTPKEKDCSSKHLCFHALEFRKSHFELEFRADDLNFEIEIGTMLFMYGTCQALEGRGSHEIAALISHLSFQ